MKKAWILFFILLCGQAIASEDMADKSDDAANQEEAVPSKLLKVQWANAMRSNLPKELCQPTSDFVTCYNIDMFDCFSMTHSIVDACVNSLDKHMPDTFTEEEGKKWGGFTGRCTFDVYTVLNKKNLKEPLCESVKNAQKNGTQDSQADKKE